MENAVDSKARGALLEQLSPWPGEPSPVVVNAAQRLTHYAVALEMVCGDPAKKQPLVDRVFAPSLRASVLGGEGPMGRAPLSMRVVY
jgi:hypothetical protein